MSDFDLAAAIRTLIKVSKQNISLKSLAKLLGIDSKSTDFERLLIVFVDTAFTSGLRLEIRLNRELQFEDGTRIRNVVGMPDSRPSAYINQATGNEYLAVKLEVNGVIRVIPLVIRAPKNLLDVLIVV